MHSDSNPLRLALHKLLSVRHRHLFAHFSKSLLWHVSCLLFAFFLTEQCQLTPAIMAAILGLSLICNAALDACAGIWFKDRLHSVALANRCQRLGATVAGIAFVFFTASCFVPTDWTIGWAILWLTVFRCSYPLIDVTQNALAAKIGGSRGGCRAIVAQRHLASGLAAIAVAYIVAPGLMIGSKAASTLFFGWACVIAVLAWLGALVHPDIDEGRQAAAESDEATPASSLGYGHALMLIFALGLIGTAFTRLAPYFLAFAVSLGSSSPLFLGSVAVGSCGSQLAWLVLRRRLSEKALGAMIACILGVSTLLMFELARIMPLALGAAGLLMGIGSGGVGFLAWSGMTLSARQSQPYFKAALFTTCSKLSEAISILVVGLCLAGESYRETLAEPLSLSSLLIALAPAVLALAILGILLTRSRPGAALVARTALMKAQR